MAYRLILRAGQAAAWACRLRCGVAVTLSDADAQWTGGHFKILSLLFVRCKLYYRVKNGVRVRRVYRRLACRVASTSVTAVNGEQ